MICSQSEWLFSRYVFQYTIDDCYFFIKRLIGVDTFAKRFMTDPVLFFQATCLRACNTERFGTEVMNEFGRLLLAEHPDFGDFGSHLEEKAEDVADAGEKSGSSDQKASGKKGNHNVNNNLVKYACCVSKQLRFTLQDALPKLFQKLVARAGFEGMDEGQEFDYTSKFGDNYTILFGSAFYLDVMEARSLLKCVPPRVRDYIRACFDIHFEVRANQNIVICLQMLWQDVVLSVHASGFLCSDMKPSHHDWLVLLREFPQIDVCEQQLETLLSSDACILSEKWSALDNAYKSRAKGFFDFEQQSKLVLHKIFEGDLTSSTVLHDPCHFEDWWSHLLTFRGQKQTDYQRNRDIMQRFAPANESATFWDISSKALWLLDFINYSREIMQDEYDLVRDIKLSGSKRQLSTVDLPKTFRQFFEFISEQILNYDSFELKQLLCIHPKTPNAKVFRNFSEWLTDHNSHQTAH
jgi:hypothetical protein